MVLSAMICMLRLKNEDMTIQERKAILRNYIMIVVVFILSVAAFLVVMFWSSNNVIYVSKQYTKSENNIVQVVNMIEEAVTEVSC